MKKELDYTSTHIDPTKKKHKHNHDCNTITFAIHRPSWCAQLSIASHFSSPCLSQGVFCCMLYGTIASYPTSAASNAEGEQVFASTKARCFLAKCSQTTQLIII